MQEEIIFNNVSFKYPNSLLGAEDLFSNIKLSIKAGTSTAIIGPSGSGKSTIVQLLLRFYDPIQGEIFFDDKDIRNIPLDKLRDIIGYVSQEPFLILGTIKDNLYYANNNATLKDMESALRKANANFVFELEHGLDTYIGSWSVSNLSGGEK